MQHHVKWRNVRHVCVRMCVCSIASFFSSITCVYCTFFQKQLTQTVRSWCQIDNNGDQDQEDEVSILQFVHCQFERQVALFDMPPSKSWDYYVAEVSSDLLLALSFCCFRDCFCQTRWARRPQFDTDLIQRVYGWFVSQKMFVCVCDMWKPPKDVKLKRFFTSTVSPCRSTY